MTLATDNAAAAASTIRRIHGPTILMGDGSYFDYENPRATQMTIEDYAWALASQGRFSGQCRARLLQGHPRVVYTVCEHVARMAEQMLRDGHPQEVAYAGLMHESDEIVFPDIAAPAKSLVDARTLDTIKWLGSEIANYFDVLDYWCAVLKQYDIRMLATEKRDLMPQAGSDNWQILDGYPPFDFEIIPWPNADHAVRRFLSLYERLRP